MIARLSFTLDGKPFTATLGDDREWSCPDVPAIEAALTVGYDATHDGPADGEPGYRAVTAAAEWLKATVEWEPKETPPPGTIY